MNVDLRFAQAESRVISHARPETDVADVVDVVAAWQAVLPLATPLPSPLGTEVTCIHPSKEQNTVVIVQDL